MRISATRMHLGEHFSEGARLLWAVMEDRSWSQGQLTRAIEAKPGVVPRWLYGDTRPSWGWAERLRDAFAIPLEAWLTAPAATFLPPAARDSEQARGLSDRGDRTR